MCADVQFAEVAPVSSLVSSTANIHHLIFFLPTVLSTYIATYFFSLKSLHLVLPPAPAEYDHSKAGGSSAASWWSARSEQGVGLSPGSLSDQSSQQSQASPKKPGRRFVAGCCRKGLCTGGLPTSSLSVQPF